MTHIQAIFDRIGAILKEEGQTDIVTVIVSSIEKQENQSLGIQNFIKKITVEIDNLGAEIFKDDSILISVKNQKLLRTCFQIITSFGISQCLIPGLGINLTKKCTSAPIINYFKLTDQDKYDILTICTNFFTRSYSIPVLKNIIISFHFSDYLAALIQLCFAPLKKPGVYINFTMTEEMYIQLNSERHKYLKVFDNLINNCFQPILMTELLVLQSATDPCPPTFAKRTISKILSQRLLAPGGVLSLIRCFTDNNEVDTGLEWKKIDMICKIISIKHGQMSDEEYISNICAQLTQIMSLNNTHYLATVAPCLSQLKQKYPNSQHINAIIDNIFKSFDFDYLIQKSTFPGTLVLSSQEVEHKINLLHACICPTKLEWPAENMLPNIYLLNLLTVKCTKKETLKIKLKDILLKCIELQHTKNLCSLIESMLFGKKIKDLSNIVVEEYEAGLTLKFVKSQVDYPWHESAVNFLDIFKSFSNTKVLESLFEALLQIFININIKRQKENLIKSLEYCIDNDNSEIMSVSEEKYALILQLLSEIAGLPTVLTLLKSRPTVVLNFIEYFLLRSSDSSNKECTSIALVLLNTILSSCNRNQDIDDKLSNLVPVLKTMSSDESDLNHILCKEALSLISLENITVFETVFSKAVDDTFDTLLPVRAHGVIELTKLIDKKDPETISKRVYLLCLFQEQLKDADSYLYLAAINGIASLGTHCTEDVLHVLCKEFLQMSNSRKDLVTQEDENKIAEMRMKTGDIIVKVTKRLGDMAVPHKTLLLNTMLCAVRDEDPLIRTSALSNLAEIAFVLHYRIGTIIYEVLLCIWSVIESDKAIECRRAAVMVISSLLKGLGRETLLQLKDNLLPIYRTLKQLYSDTNEDQTVRLHAQIALEELNDIVKDFLFPEVDMEKRIFVLDKPEDRL